MKRFILRNSKRIVSGFFFVLLLLVCVLFSHDRITAASRGGYEILSYDCHYKVGEENVYHVTETIVVIFHEYRHGIYRYIPEVNYIRRLDGSTDTIIDSIDVTSCSDEYEDYREGDSRMLKLGDPDEEIIGTHVYVINYDVHWGNDRLEGADEFYMNLVGDGWDVEIPNFTFTIELPYDFEDTGDNIGLYYGGYAESLISGIVYSKEENIIKGRLNNAVINPGEFFSVRIELPDGYFKKTSGFPIDGLIALILCCVFMIVSLLVWMFKGRDDDIIEVAEFFPPDGLNCAELAYAYFGKIESKDVVPMLIGLASRGYIKINQDDDIGRNFSFKILKEYEGSDRFEREFMRGLSKYGNVITKKELENSFYKTINIIKKDVESTLKPKIFVVNTLYFRLLTLPLALIPYIVGLYHSIRFYSGDALDGLIGSVGFFVVTTAAAMFISSPKKNPFLKLFVGAIWVAVMWVTIKLFGDAISYQGTFYWVVLAACVVANMIQMIFYRIIDKRTEYGIDLLGRIRGFRRYLIEASPRHLESRIEDDPEYYYKILPYTYVLGVTDAWIKNFESIAVEPPKWFKGFRSSVFDFRHFNRFMSRTMYSAERSMTSTPSSSSSGGGHSGGGGGGGGGGSW